MWLIIFLYHSLLQRFFFVLYYLEFLMYFLIFRAMFFDYLPLKATEENNGGVHETLNSSTVNKKASYLLY